MRTLNVSVIKFCIDQLKEVGAKGYEFDMFSWGSSDHSHPVGTPEPECGFAGCFLGWAAHQQWFDQFGLAFRLSQQHPTHNGTRDVADLMGISSHTLDLIILPEWYYVRDDVITPTMVAERLKDLLDMGEEDFVDKYGDGGDGGYDDYPDDDDDDDEVTSEVTSEVTNPADKEG
jgi:hypothetical protein